MKRPRRSLGDAVSSSTSGRDDTATLLGRTQSENRGRSGGMGLEGGGRRRAVDRKLEIDNAA